MARRISLPHTRRGHGQPRTTTGTPSPAANAKHPRRHGHGRSMDGTSPSLHPPPAAMRCCFYFLFSSRTCSRPAARTRPSDHMRVLRRTACRRRPAATAAGSSRCSTTSTPASDGPPGRRQFGRVTPYCPSLGREHRHRRGRALRRGKCQRHSSTHQDIDHRFPGQRQQRAAAWPAELQLDFRPGAGLERRPAP